MISEGKPDLDRNINREFGTLADDDRVKRATINREITPGRITVVFVDEVLGF